MTGFNGFHASGFNAFIDSGFNARGQAIAWVVVGQRSTEWQGSDGSAANLWALTDRGALVQAVDVTAIGANLRAIARTFDGVGYIIGSSGARDEDKLVRLDEEFNPLWTFGEVLDLSTFLTVSTDSNDSVLLGAGAGSTNSEAAARKVKSDGSAEIWSYNTDSRADSSTTVQGSAIGADGNHYICGSPSSEWDGTDGSVKTVWKLNASGAVQWAYRTWPNDKDNELARAIDVDASGNVYVGSARTDQWEGTDGSFAGLWKLNSSGSVVWTQDPGVSVLAVRIDADGNVHAGGEPNGSGESYWVYAADGTLLRSYGTSGATSSVAGIGINTKGKVALAGVRGDSRSVWSPGASSGAIRWMFDTGSTAWNVAPVDRLPLA